MTRADHATSIEELLAHAGWLRSLALCLAGDASTADDAVQDAWLAAMRNAPETRESERPWLTTVLRNALRMRVRTEQRRDAREQAAALSHQDVPTPETLLAKAQMQRLLAELVLRLDEPYRSTVLLHFGEGLSLADIARSQGIAASTARGRLSIALGQLRRWLDKEAGGRRQWSVALLIIPNGVVVAQKTKLIAPVVILLLLLLAGGAYWTWFGGATGAGSADSSDDAGRGSAANGPWQWNPNDGRRDANTPPAWLGQPGVAPRRVAGRVIFEGQPVAGAVVELASLASASGYGSAPRLTTNDDGQFDFGKQPAMEFVVRANAPGRTGTAVGVDLRNPSEQPPPDELQLELSACDSALFGTVSDASGGPVSGARLERLALAGSFGVPGGAGVETDAEGSYELCLEPSWPTWLAVEVSADGYGAIVYNGKVFGRVQLDFELVPAAAIVGRVVHDETDEPVPMAHVFVPRGPWSIEQTAWRGTFADAQGRFRIDGLAPGRHVVLARADGMVLATRGITVDVEAGETTGDVEIRMVAGSRIRGIVREAGKPVAGARVRIANIDGSRGARSAVSQADGSFSLDEVPRGTVRFAARPWEVVSPESFQVERKVHEGVVLDVESLGAISGLVVRNKRPIATARIDIWGPNERDLGPVSTDARGRFEVRGLSPGPWTLFASSQREGAFGRAPTTVEVTNGSTHDVTIELSYSAAISGVVVDQDGSPVADVSVDFFHTSVDDHGTAITAVDGTFRATTMMGSGSYRPVVRLSPGSSTTLAPAVGTELPLIALDDGSSEVTGVRLIVHVDRLSIAGRVVDTAGAAVADARVTIKMMEADRPPQFYRWIRDAATTTDVQGAFAVGELPAGTYAVQARTSTGSDVVLAGVKAGRTDVVVVLPTPGAIEGALVGFDDPPQVSAIRYGEVGTDTIVRGTVNGSSFWFRGLSPGAYALTARSSTEAASARVQVVAGSTSTVTLSSGGSGTVSGRVIEFRTGKPVEGMTCHALVRVDSEMTAACSAIQREPTKRGGSSYRVRPPATRSCSARACIPCTPAAFGFSHSSRRSESRLRFQWSRGGTMSRNPSRASAPTLRAARCSRG